MSTLLLCMECGATSTQRGFWSTARCPQCDGVWCEWVAYMPDSLVPKDAS